MSIIACKVYPDRIELASDSIRVSGWSQRTDSKTTKLARIGDVIVGGAGLASENGLFQLYLKTHRPSAPTIDAVLTLLSEFADWKLSKTTDASLENTFILAFGGKAFITSGYFVDEIANFYAVGAGEDQATTALHLGHSPVEAVQAAIDLSVYCEGPIHTQVLRKD